MNDEALSIAATLATRWEGFEPRPYLDPVGVATIGYGMTRYPNGRVVTLGDPAMSEAVAAILLKTSLAQLVPVVRRLCPGADTPGRLGALTDFTYNLGLTRLKASTLRLRANAGRWGDVPRQLRRWVHAGGRVLPGLVLRREAEICLI
jgi:lysozyme